MYASVLIPCGGLSLDDSDDICNNGFLFLLQLQIHAKDWLVVAHPLLGPLGEAMRDPCLMGARPL